MRGQVLEFNAATGTGLISGEDGRRYAVAQADLQQTTTLAAGAQVDFLADGETARQVYVLSAPLPGTPRPLTPADATGEDLSLWGYFLKAMRLSFDGNGRARRKEYWGFTLFSILFTTLITIAAVILVFGIEGATSQGWLHQFWPNFGSFAYDDGHYRHDVGVRWPSPFTLLVIALTLLSYLVFLPASITVSIRRLHDVGLTGWLYLIPLLLWHFGGWLFMLIVALIPSQYNANQYGLYPKPV